MKIFSQANLIREIRIITLIQSHLQFFAQNPTNIAFQGFPHVV